MHTTISNSSFIEIGKTKNTTPRGGIEQGFVAHHHPFPSNNTDHTASQTETKASKSIDKESTTVLAETKAWLLRGALAHVDSLSPLPEASFDANYA